MSQRTFFEVLNKKKKLKNLDIRKYGVNHGSRIYINERLCPYYRRLWGKCKGLWQDKVIPSFYTINGILQIKNSEHDKAIIITQDEDLCQFSDQEQLLKVVRKYFSSAWKCFSVRFLMSWVKKYNFLLIFWQIHYTLLLPDVSVKYDKYCKTRGSKNLTLTLTITLSRDGGFKGFCPFTPLGKLREIECWVRKKLIDTNAILRYKAIVTSRDQK